MSLDTTLAKLKFVEYGNLAFPETDQDLIRQAVAILYTSTRGAEMLEQIGSTLTFKYNPSQSLESVLGQRIVRWDPEELKEINVITSSGVIEEVSVLRAVVHELTHAIEGKRDF